MIEVSVQPSRLVAGRQACLAIRFTNTGQGACSKVVFKLDVPVGIALLQGRSKVEIPSIPAGGSHTHEMTVEPAKAGSFRLESGNFSYRNEFGVSVPVTDFRWELSVEAAPPVRPVVARPTPRPVVELEHGGSTLTVGEWGEIRILVHNASGVPLSDVTVAVTGPFEGDPARARKVSVLPDRKTARVTFSISAPLGGQLPVTVHTTSSFPDALGAMLQQTQEDRVHVKVLRPAEQVAASVANAMQTATTGRAPHGQTILYLSACPRDMEPLRTNDELREVTQELQLGPDRDDFRLEWCPAVRGTDISRALGRYRPRVVHFSGHGDREGGLYVGDETGLSELAAPDGLADLFGGYSATINCVIVNACHSMKLANAMADRIDYVIGMRCEIGDQAAIFFSVGFYQGLFAGRSVPDAFNQGRALIRLRRETNLEFKTPVLLTRDSG
jgi:hypothetical protein